MTDSSLAQPLGEDRAEGPPAETRQSTRDAAGYGTVSSNATAKFG
jgi:hypothetical protein